MSTQLYLLTPGAEIQGVSNTHGGAREGAGRPTTPPEERFWRFVNKGDGNGCWEWTGQKDRKTGLGYFTGHGNKTIAAHRFSWMLHRGNLPTKGTWLVRTCRNRGCVQPEHIASTSESEAAVTFGREGPATRDRRTPMVPCRKCNQPRAVGQRCGPCRAAYEHERNQGAERRAAKTAARLAMRAARQASRPAPLSTEERLARARAWRERKLAEDPSFDRDYAYRRKYSMSLDEVRTQIAQQGGHCGTCEFVLDPEMAKDPDTGRVLWGVDHDHDSGDVRGILCHDCNNGLKHFRDRPDVLRRAAEYLEHPPAAHLRRKALVVRETGRRWATKGKLNVPDGIPTGDNLQ